MGVGSLKARMHRFLALATVERGIRWALAGIFLYSGLVKLADPARFATVIAGFGLLPEGLVVPAALLLPALEVVAGTGIFLAVRGSLALIAGMLILFMAVLLYGIHLGLDIDCGCFGPEDPEQAYKSLRVALVRDAVMMAAVLFVYWRRDLVRWRTGRLKQ
ncbi:MauE/DoxX family redox-associated membrane protein [uncultured Desulfobulbus sp.]|uniref:MauE/DoxX family redox-associated membrane protein n=1 Tax=uncultured Desulfobulbus sp. TaxID=239745 RepID=UPI0029C7F98B|nr:MauE/DoxX family redox-associated membrane protein [uncultured Desulfobulbus sp.]